MQTAPASPACHTNTATPRPWLRADIAQHRLNMRRWHPETTGLADPNTVCKAWPAPEIMQQLSPGCAGCARLPADWQVLAAANHLRGARKELGLTQDDLARKIGISQSQVAKIEAGKKKPTPKIAAALAAVLGPAAVNGATP